ncbi:MAG: hypothetical protein HW380_2548 [Magnetococcales bacterium]|nr:hypothetical protein [Magnetococcales bacterium]HIJ83541.1 hypothetical protein [Magnetococcales bacterium]
MSEVIDEIKAVVGDYPLKLLLTRYSGKRVCVPQTRNLGPTHDLALCLGMKTAEAFCGRFGGHALYIPKNTAATLVARNQAIIKDYGAGLSVREMVRKYGLNERSVHRILNGK